MLSLPSQSSVIQIALIVALVLFLIGFVVRDAIPKAAIQIRMYKRDRNLKNLKRLAELAGLDRPCSPLLHLTTGISLT